MSDTLRLGPGPEGASLLAEWVDRQAAGLDAALAYALRLCAEELAGNVLMHGAAGALHLTWQARPPRLIVEDDGPPFDPTAIPPPALPASLDAARPGGLGLLLARGYSRGLRYRRADGWNRVEVDF